MLRPKIEPVVPVANPYGSKTAALQKQAKALHARFKQVDPQIKEFVNNKVKVVESSDVSEVLGEDFTAKEIAKDLQTYFMNSVSTQLFIST
jgi:hypothetical protein